MAVVKVLSVFLISWVAGIGAYCFAWFRMEGRIDTSELIAVAFWMAIATVPFVFFYGIPISRLNRSRERMPALLYGIGCALVGVVPITLLKLLLGGFSVRGILEPESFLLFAHFGTFGFTFGILYAVFLRDLTATARQDRE